MTMHDQFCSIVATAVQWWSMEARAELADWLAVHADADVRSLASVARHFQPPGPPLRVLPRYYA